MGTENLTLGRGKVFFAPYPKGARTGGIKGYFGNTPTLQMTQSRTALDHYNAEGGLREKDKTVTLNADMSFTFSCDEVNDGNLTLWFGGNNDGSLPADAPTDLGSLAIIGATHDVYGAFWFESDNPSGPNRNFWCPYVKLTPTGNVDLKSESWQMVQFQVEVLKRDRTTERIYVFAPTANVSTAADDLTPLFDANVGDILGYEIANTLAFVSPPSVADIGVPFDITASINSGVAPGVAYLFINNGTLDLSSVKAIVGTTGDATTTMTYGNAGTIHIYAYNNPHGTGTPLDFTANIVVS